MHKLIIVNVIAVFSFYPLIGQDCPIINENGSFEEMIYVPGGEPAIGITTGQIENWSASHGTVDYLTPEWNWDDIEGISSNTGFMCYGNRDSHDHSEGMFTTANMYADDDLLYTIALDYGTVCDAPQNGFLNIALNNKLTAEGHHWFQYPTPEALPSYFEEIQAIDRFELKPDVNFVDTGMSRYEMSFVPLQDFNQLWLFTEYQYPMEDFVNCGLMIDNVEITVSTSALSGITIKSFNNHTMELTPQFSKNLNVLSYDWSIGNEKVGDEEKLLYAFDEEIYTICLDILDDRGACGSVCHELDLREIESSNDVCTYSACLDLGGLPNITSLEFFNSQGALSVIDENITGFFFPYCVGTPSMCAGGETELELLIEDLNAYFNKLDLNTTASLGYSSAVSSLDCRSMSITIKSSGLVPSTITLDDFLSDEEDLTSIEFDYDSNNCSSNIINEEDQFGYDLNIETDVEASDKAKEKSSIFEVVVEEKQPKFHEEKQEEIISEGGIFNMAGQQLLAIRNHKVGDEVNVELIPTGMYIIRLVSQKGESSNFFFKGE